MEFHRNRTLLPESHIKCITIYAIMVLVLQFTRYVTCGEKLALLSATLRTYQKLSCDIDEVVISCPRGTSISIEFAQYNNFGNKGDFDIGQLCPLDKYPKRLQTKVNPYVNGSTLNLPSSKHKPIQRLSKNVSIRTIPYTSQPNISSNTNKEAGVEIDDNNIHLENSSTIISIYNASSDNCMWPNALQYSLLQTVVEACQKKKHCKFQGASHDYRLGDDSNYSATAFNMDPCHKRRKVVEVAYKCRPYEFRSKVACHNDIAQLECNPYSRIAVYSANFGRTEYESIQCPQPQGVREETCQASYTTETVMQICHGRRRCNLAADANTFGSPCQPNSRMYLKVVYTCVPKQVLKDRYEAEVEGDETKEFEGDSEIYDDELNYEAIPKVYNNSTVIDTRTHDGNLSTLNLNNANISFHLEIPDSINPANTQSIDLNLEGDQERLYLYLLMIGTGGIFVCIIAVSAHILMQRHESVRSEEQISHINNSAKACVNTTIPNLCNDTMSEIDAGITTPKTVSVSSKAKNKDYIIYGLNSRYSRPTANRFENSTCALQGSSSTPTTEAVVGSVSSSLITNSEICKTGQSPDVIDILTKTYKQVTASKAIGGQVSFGGILPSNIVIGDNRYNNNPSINCGNAAPMASLPQFISPSATHPSYISNSDEFIQGMPTSTGRIQHSVTPVLSSITPSAFHSILQTQQLSYDGTEPRTLSTGIPANSQFYYG